jgi:hypothetical protein
MRWQAKEGVHQTDNRIAELKQRVAHIKLDAAKASDAAAAAAAAATKSTNTDQLLVGTQRVRGKSRQNKPDVPHKALEQEKESQLNKEIETIEKKHRGHGSDQSKKVQYQSHKHGIGLRLKTSTHAKKTW